jgi:hypothetical protein
VQSRTDRPPSPPAAPAVVEDGGSRATPGPDGEYGAASRRYLSALDRRDYPAAVRALDEAIACEPSQVEAWHRRSLLWRLLGDYVRASLDDARCVALDPHHRDRDATARRALALFAAYQHDPVTAGLGAPPTCRDTELRRVLAERASRLAFRQRLVERPSCDLPCPSLCCHFEEEPIVNGVHLDAGELSTVRSYLAERDLREDEYLGRVERGRAPGPARQHPEWFLPDGDGREYAYYPRRGAARLGDVRRPRMLTCAELPWLTSGARACVFVTATGCAIHDLGDPPGLLSCRHFVCLTAFVLLAARDLGAVTTRDLADRSMPDLHDAALAALRPLSAACTSAEALSAYAGMRSALAAALASDQSGDWRAVRLALTDYAAAARAEEALVANARQEAAAVLERTHRREKP